MEISLKAELKVKIDNINQYHKDLLLYECEESLDKGRIQGEVISVQALSEGKVIGLGIAEFDDQSGISNIRSMYIKPDFRGKRIGTQILKSLVANLEEQGCKEVYFLYQSNWDSFEFMTSHLAAHGWSGPEEINKVFVIDISKRHDEIMQLETPVAEVVQVETWENQSRERMDKLKDYLSENTDIPTTLDPFRNKENIAPKCSMVAIDNNKIVGWNMSYIKGENAREYSNLFIDKKFRSRGLIWSLFLSSVKVQANLGIDTVIGLIDVKNIAILDYYIRRISNNQFKSHSHFRFSKSL